MSIYRVHFSWKEKELILKARSLDLTHPYFVSIKDLVFTKETRLVIDPAEDDVLKEFGGSNHLMIPFQTVKLIEEIPDEDAAGGTLKLFRDGDKTPGAEESESLADDASDRGGGDPFEGEIPLGSVSALIRVRGSPLDVGNRDDHMPGSARSGK